MTNSIPSFNSNTAVGHTRNKPDPTLTNEPKPSQVDVKSPPSMYDSVKNLSTEPSVVAKKLFTEKNDSDVKLSPEAKRTLDTDPTFDRQKVDDIKSALRQGNYPLDSKKIAESFMALEKMISN